VHKVKEENLEPDTEQVFFDNENESSSELDILNGSQKVSLKQKIVGECLALSEEEYRKLLDKISVKIRMQTGNSGRNLRKGLREVSPQSLLVAAVFFVRYDYSYQKDGFWQPFIDSLCVDYTQNNRTALAEHFDRAFHEFDLFRPSGGYRYVSPLIYHSVLPNDGIRHFAEIIAHQEALWSYWASADAEEIIGFLKSRQISKNMRRLLENDGKLVADLFVDVCDYLATGRPTTDGTCGLDVGAIAAAVKKYQEQIQQGNNESIFRTRHDKWYIPQPDWVWQHSEARLGLRIPTFRLAGEPGDYVKAILKVGSHESSLQVDLESRRTAPLFIDSWFLNMDSGTTQIELICDGHERAKRSVTTLDRSSPIVELNDSLIPLRMSLDVPSKAFWLLPEGTVTGDGIKQITSEIAPFPLHRWQAGLFDSAGQKNWKFQRQKMQLEEYMCNVEQRLSWLLQTSSNPVCIVADASQGPVFTDWPEIELLGDAREDGFVCEVHNLGTGEQKTYSLRDIIERDEAGVCFISHKSLCCEFESKIGSFRVKLKTSSFRTVSTAPAICYCFVPLFDLQIPHIVLPEDEYLEIHACIGKPLRHIGIKAVGAILSESDEAHIKIRWPAGTDDAFELNTPVPLRLQLKVPRISWGVDGNPVSGFVTLPECAASDTSKNLILTTDPEQPAILQTDSWQLERPEGISRWIVPFTSFYEQVEKATSRTVSIKLVHAGRIWEVVRFRRNLLIESIMHQLWGTVLFMKVRLSAETDDHLYAIVARTGEIAKENIRFVKLDPTGEEGVTFDLEGFLPGKWCVVFRLCSDDMPNHGELLKDERDNTAHFKFDLTTIDIPIPSLETSIAENLLTCADWQLPIHLYVPLARRNNMNSVRDDLLASLAIRSGEEGRRTMEHLASEGINFASFPPSLGKAHEHTLLPEDLANLWQPLTVSSCTNIKGSWTEAAANLLGHAHEHPLFLPEGTIVQCENQQYEVAEKHTHYSVDRDTYGCFKLDPYRSGNNSLYLLFGERDHYAALHTTETLPLADKNEMIAIRREDINTDTFPSLLDRSWSQGMQLIYENRVPPELLPRVLMIVNERQPAYKNEFLVKGYWQWTHNAAGTKDFRNYWEKTRYDCAGAYPWLREHLGEELGGMRSKRLFMAELTRACRKILIQTTRQIEQAFPYHHDNGAYAYPGFLYVLAVYNRLAARFPEKIAAIRPESKGQEWLCEHSAMAFRDARLMLNYWLILVESILNWWNLK